MNTNGALWRTRVHACDAPFGVEKTDSIVLTSADQKKTYPSLPTVSTFDDGETYWHASDPDAGVKVPDTGATIEVKGQSGGGAFVQVQVSPAK